MEYYVNLPANKRCISVDESCPLLLHPILMRWREIAFQQVNQGNKPDPLISFDPQEAPLQSQLGLTAVPSNYGSPGLTRPQSAGHATCSHAGGPYQGM
jgi:hypothetical protein